jgi:hypothetical protein
LPLQPSLPSCSSRRLWQAGSGTRSPDSSAKPPRLPASGPSLPQECWRTPSVTGFPLGFPS